MEECGRQKRSDIFIEESISLIPELASSKFIVFDLLGEVNELERTGPSCRNQRFDSTSVLKSQEWRAKWMKLRRKSPRR